MYSSGTAQDFSKSSLQSIASEFSGEPNQASGESGYIPSSREYRAERRKQWEEKRRAEKQIQKVQKKKKRARNAERVRPVDARIVNTVYRLMLVGILIIVVAFVAVTFFRVRTIEVSGCENCQPMIVAEASGIQTGDKLLFVDRRKASDGILSVQPYAHAIRIRRKFPSTLVIEVIESKPAAAVVNGNTAYLIDKDCKLLEYMPLQENPCEVIIEGLKVKQSVPGQKIELENTLYVPSLSLLLDKLDTAGILPRVTHISAAYLYNVTFRYDGRLTVELGDMTEIDRKLELFAVVEKQLSDQIRGRLSITDNRVTFTEEN